MPSYQVAFARHWFLGLLLLRLGCGGRGGDPSANLVQSKQRMALSLGLAVLTELTLALAEVRLVSDRLTVMYLLDQSFSIPLQQRRAMLVYVTRDASAQRVATGRDRADVSVPYSAEYHRCGANLPVLESLAAARRAR